MVTSLNDVIGPEEPSVPAGAISAMRDDRSVMFTKSGSRSLVQRRRLGVVDVAEARKQIASRISVSVAENVAAPVMTADAGWAPLRCASTPPPIPMIRLNSRLQASQRPRISDLIM